MDMLQAKLCFSPVKCSLRGEALACLWVFTFLGVRSLKHSMLSVLDSLALNVALAGCVHVVCLRVGCLGVAAVSACACVRHAVAVNG